jgi:diguanylate cyclase (GGDEF)-like protein/PAS domain S-box-containing protein
MTAFSEPIEPRILKALLERATVSAWIVDETETILFVNSAAFELTGYAPDELVGQPISLLMQPGLAAEHADYIRGFLQRGGESQILGHVREFQMVHRNGQTVPIELKAFALPEARHGKRLFSAFISDNSGHKLVETEMARKAREDYLTGCLNRLGFMERARQELSRARRSGAALSLIVMDLDRFKRINDTHGHQGGDTVLADLLPALGDSLRAHDVFGRVGGEEFFILLPETDIGEAAAVAERFREALEGHAFLCNQRTVQVTASLGCAALRAEDDLDRLIQRADRRMYLAKNAGRNRVVATDVASSGQDSKAPEEHSPVRTRAAGDSGS